MQSVEKPIAMTNFAYGACTDNDNEALKHWLLAVEIVTISVI